MNELNQTLKEIEQRDTDAFLRKILHQSAEICSSGSTERHQKIARDFEDLPTPVLVKKYWPDVERALRFALNLQFALKFAGEAAL